ncbi:hypothetical protein BDZ91DRAFT_114074 [Kalaharituber pfeilii]|nr:hypothetical protein BDZ91DRAFT_114074 [Kalaharituber pfeilii]
MNNQQPGSSGGDPGIGKKIRGRYLSRPKSPNRKRSRSTGLTSQRDTSLVTIPAPSQSALQSAPQSAPQSALQSTPSYNNLPSNPTRDEIEGIIKDLHSVHTESKEKQWKYTNRLGQRVAVVERIGPILKCMESYANIVDVAIQHHPDITALVWSTVRVILKVALDYAQLMESLEVAVAIIVNTMAKCEFYAYIYKNIPLEATLHPGSTQNAFKHKLDYALKELYDAVWNFTDKVKGHFDTTSRIRQIANMFKPFSEVIQPYLDEISKKEKVVRECADEAGMKRIMDNSGKLEQMERVLNEIEQKMGPLSRVDEILNIASENLSVTKRMDMRLQLIEDRLAPENVIALETHQREVLGISLEENLLRLKDDYLTEHEMEEFQYNLYVAVEATEQPYADERVDLLQHVQDFIRGGTKQICLIQGSAGSGKSTFNHYLARHLWSEYERASKQTEAAIPLFISLTSIVSSKPDSEDLIASYFSDRDFTEQDINLARRTRRFVFMLDGYDEIERRDCNFYAKNKLSRWKAKIIITSRPEYLGSGYHSKFHPPNRRDLLQEYWLAPFSTDTIKSYISGFLQAKPTGRPARDYEAYLTQPEIRDMISNPFLLRMIMTVEPSMDHEFLINRVDLYKRFFGHCLAKAQSRLDNIQLTSDQRRIFQRLCDETFSDHAEQFCRDFALELYRHKAVEVTYRPGTARGSSAGEGILSGKIS